MFFCKYTPKRISAYYQAYHPSTMVYENQDKLKLTVLKYENTMQYEGVYSG